MNKTTLFAASLALVLAVPAVAQMPMGQMRAALEATSDKWIAFREYDGRQLIYFSQLVSWKCALAEVRYSVNSDTLDEQFPLPECNPQIPFHVGEKDKIHLNFKPGTARTVSVQVVYGDGTESAVRTYKPCDVEGDVTCAALADPQ